MVALTVTIGSGAENTSIIHGVSVQFNPTHSHYLNKYLQLSCIVVHCCGKLAKECYRKELKKWAGDHSWALAIDSSRVLTWD